MGDVTARMLVQRAAPQESLASVFAVVEAIALFCSVLGSLLVQLAVAVAGPRVAAASTGALVGLLVLATFGRLRRVDDAADAPVVAIRLLRRVPIFAPLPPPALEVVARAAEPASYPPATVIAREGDVGDRYFAVADGEVHVSQNGCHLRTMRRGDGFGEIALLADVPRTATVTSATGCELLAIGRAPFLAAVTGHEASQRVAWTLAERFTGSPMRPSA
jgi:hypothetical protein